MRANLFIILIITFAINFTFAENYTYKDFLELYNQGKYQKAISLILEKKDKKLSEKYLLALCYYKIRKYKESEKLFLEVLNTNAEGFPTCYYYLARINLIYKNIDKAEKYLEYALSYFPNSSYCYVIKGIIDAQKNRKKEALADFEKAIKLDNQNHWAYNNYGLFLLRLGNYDKAKELFLKAVNLSPNNPYYWNNLGISQENLKEYNEALKSYQKALQLKSDYKKAKINLKRVKDILTKSK